MNAFRLKMVAAGAMLLSTMAYAQSACPSGQAANGACVNPSLANTVQVNMLVGSQPQLSYTAFPVMPSDDGTTHYPNQIFTNQQPPSMTGRPVCISNPRGGSHC